MRRLLTAAATASLLLAQAPVLAEGTVDSNIANGNFAFTKPYLMSVSYARSAEDNALYALAITVKDQEQDENGLDISTALSVNCKTGRLTAAFGFDVVEPIKTGQLIAGGFCMIHKKQFSHSYW